MLLKQNMRSEASLSERQKEQIYQRFKKRCKTKSEHAYVDRGESPIQLRLFFLGTYFNSTNEYLVMYDSFEIIYGSSPGTEQDEIGFRVKLKSIMLDENETATLEVLRRQFKATLILPS